MPTQKLNCLLKGHSLPILQKSNSILKRHSFIFQHYSETRKDFAFKLGNFFIDKWVTICTIKLEDRPFHVAMVMAQIKGLTMTFSKKTFLHSDCRNGSSNYLLVTLPSFAKFHPQTTEIQPFKVECFSMKMLKFQHNDVIISDVSGISFDMWNRLVMSYYCAKFCCDMTLIAYNTCIFHAYFLYFSTNRQRFQRNDVIIYDVTVTINL